MKEGHAGVAAVRRVFVAMLAGSGLAALPGHSSAAAGAPIGTFSASAIAQGARISLTRPGVVPFSNDVVDLGAPVAEATADYLGGHSFASLPYPGSVVIGGPGLVDTAVPPGTSVPSYPFYAVADSGRRTDDVSDPSGSYGLRATVEPGRSTATAALGRGAGVVRDIRTAARSEVSALADRVVATAVAEIDGVTDATGTLAIGQITSTAITTMLTGRRPVTVTSLTITAGRVGGLTFAYGPAGLTVGGQVIPVPPNQAQATLNQALAPAHVKIGIVSGTALEDGGVADAIDIVAEQSIQDRPTHVAVRLGGAMSRVSLGRPVPGLSHVPLSGPPSSPGRAIASSEAAAVNPVAPGTVAAEPVPVPPQHTRDQRSVLRSAGAILPRSLDALASVYLPLTVCAALLLGVSWAFRRVGGVRP